MSGLNEFTYCLDRYVLFAVTKRGATAIGTKGNLVRLFRAGFLPSPGSVQFTALNYGFWMSIEIQAEPNWPREFWGTP